MGSKTFDGVWFISYSHDHMPPHVHGSYAGLLVIVDLLPDGKVRQAERWNAVVPSNGKRSDARHIIAIAANHAGELMQLWEKSHGKTS